MEQPIRRFIPLITEQWEEPGDRIVSYNDNAVIMPFTTLFPDLTDDTLNKFITKPKRLYHTNKEVREHMCGCINYFEKYFDKDKELIMVYFNIKLLIDRVKEYSLEALMQDIDRYVVVGLRRKIDNMNCYNYIMDLSNKNNVTINPKLHYSNSHGRAIMKASLLINIVIPIVTHFIYINKLTNTDEILMAVYEVILNRITIQDGINVLNKIRETSKRAAGQSLSQNPDNWKTQAIIGYNVSMHVEASVINLIVNVFCKYRYDSHLVHLNHKALRELGGWKVNKAPFDYNFTPINSYKSDDGKTTEADKYEGKLVKEDESIYIQTVVNGDQVIKYIESKFGQVSDEEVNYYIENIGEINIFQKSLVSYLFYKYFGDPQSVKLLSNINIIKLMVCGKRMLLHLGLTVMPYIISGKIIRFPNAKKNISKKETENVSSSIYFKQIQDTYKSKKIEEQIMGIFATILTADFTIIDYDNQELTGTTLPNIELAKYKISDEIITVINLINMR